VIICGVKHYDRHGKNGGKRLWQRRRKKKKNVVKNLKKRRVNAVLIAQRHKKKQFAELLRYLEKVVLILSISSDSYSLERA
jgi:hypothetical protein